MKCLLPLSLIDYLLAYLLFGWNVVFVENRAFHELQEPLLVFYGIYWADFTRYSLAESHFVRSFAEFVEVVFLQVIDYAHVIPVIAALTDEFLIKIYSKRFFLRIFGFFQKEKYLFVWLITYDGCINWSASVCVWFFTVKSHTSK